MIALQSAAGGTFELGQVVAEVVEVRLFAGEDVAHRLEAGRLIERAGEDPRGVLPGRLPEQVGPALTAKAPPRPF